MAMKRFPFRLQPLALTALVAPAISLLGGHAVAWLVGSTGLEMVLPVGLHTYVPAATVVPQAGLAIVSAAGMLGALVLVIVGALRRGRSTVPARSVGQGLLMLALLGVAAQLLLFAAQLVVVDEVRGIADGATALLLAGTLQAVLVALLAGGGWLLAQLPGAPVSSIRVGVAALAIAPALALAARTAGGRRHLCTPRRGPPLLSVSHST
jgi:hypothetical protein